VLADGLFDMRRYAVIEKPLGETPLQAIREFQKSDPALLQMPMTYAGRLDPMAEGKLLVLLGDECKKRGKYDGLDKEYIFEVLLGFKSDTGDMLGLPSAGAVINTTLRDPNEVARSMIGIHTLPYPAFSSKTVGGKPLFQYALDGTLDTIRIPTTDMRVYAMEYVDKLMLPRAQLIERIIDKIHLLQTGSDDAYGGDFRKDEICKAWWGLQSRTIANCAILRFSAVVSSGTYIRSLAPLMAEKFGSVGLAYSIKRTKIGKYLPLVKRIGFWRRTY
jgi:tRNA pseudouridine55 synthase